MAAFIDIAMIDAAELTNPAQCAGDLTVDFVGGRIDEACRDVARQPLEREAKAQLGVDPAALELRRRARREYLEQPLRRREVVIGRESIATIRPITGSWQSRSHTPRYASTPISISSESRGNSLRTCRGYRHIPCASTVVHGVSASE